MSVVEASRKKINKKVVCTIQRDKHAMIDFIIFGEMT